MKKGNRLRIQFVAIAMGVFLFAAGPYVGFSLKHNGEGSLSSEVSAVPATTPSYNYRVSSNIVKDPSGAVVFTGSNMSAALNWALCHANTVTYVPAGTYVLTGRVSGFASGTTLYGDGPENTIFDFQWTRGSKGITDYEQEIWWTFGFQPTDVSYVTIKQFTVTGDGCVRFLTNSGTTRYNAVEDVVVRDTSDIQASAIGSLVANNGAVADHYRFIRCTAYNTGGDGFGLWGKNSATSDAVLSHHSNMHFEDCKALWCGYSRPFYNWVPGFCIGDRGSASNVTFLRCEASYNWESGFHFEEWGGLIHPVLTDCIANYNGQKYSDPRGAYYGYGCLCDVDTTTFVNFTAIGNHNSHNGGKYGWAQNYPDTEGYTYRVGTETWQGDDSRRYVYNLDGSVAYVGVDFTAAFKWAVGHAGAIVKLAPSDDIKAYSSTYPYDEVVVPQIVTSSVYLAEGVTVYGHPYGGASPSRLTAIKFSNPADGLIISNSNTRVLDLWIFDGALMYMASGNKVITNNQALGVRIYHTTANHVAAVYVYAEAGSAINGLELGAISVWDAHTSSYAFTGSVTGLKKIFCKDGYNYLPNL